jgi:mRNA interferase MazF
VKRGEVWTASGGADYAGKPRPVVILQSDRFDRTTSITICSFTTDPVDAGLFRILIEASPQNGLRKSSRLMGDKITTIPRMKLGRHIGRLSDEDMARLENAVLVFLGLAD